MAFNAGAIEATLTLNRSPFTAGLLAARSQARSFANERYEATARISVDRNSLNQAVQQLRNFDRNSRQALARVLVDRVAFDKLVRDLRAFGGSVYVARARVDIDDANLRALRESLRDIEVRIRASGGAFGGFGDQGQRAFSRVHGAARLLIAALPLLLPVAGAAITGVIGLLGALTAAFVTAGIGVGAFAAVVKPVFDRVKEAVAGGKAEIDKLPPSLRLAANAMVEMNAQYNKLVELTQRRVGLAMAQGFEVISAVLKTLHPVIDRTADGLLLIGQMAEKYFGSSHWRDFTNLIAANMVPILTKLFEIVAFGTRAVINLTTAFMPMAQWLLSSISKGMQDFANWTGTLASDPRFHAWVETAKEALHRFWDWLVATVKFIFEFSYAMAPLGTAIMNVLAIIFNGMSKLPPEWLNGIAMGLSAIFAAIMLGASGPVGIAIGVVLGLAAAFGTLYDSNETVRKSIDNLMNSIRATFLPIWETIRSNVEDKIIPAFNNLVTIFNLWVMPVLRELWQQVQDKIVPALHSLIGTITGRLIPAFLEWFTAAQPMIAWWTEFFGKTLIHIFEGATRIIEGAVLVITGIFQTFTGVLNGDWEKMGQGLTTISEGFWTAIAGIFGMSLDELKVKYDEWDRNITNAWSDFWGGIKTEQDGSQTQVRGKWQDFWVGVDEWGFNRMRIIRNNWADMWGGVKTEQDGSQTQVNGKWQDFWIGVDNWGFERMRIIRNNWAEMWGGVKVEQDGSQTQVNGRWQDFWVGVDNWGFDRMRIIRNNWADMWGGVKTEQDGSQTQVRGKWGEFWDWMGQKMGDIGQWIGNKWKEVTDWIGRTTEQAAAYIGEKWRAVANFFRAPINWVINVVINDGILRAWNAVMGWIGAPALKVSPVGQIPAFAQGGPIHGGIPNKDSVPILTMPGEYVLSKRAIENMGGLSRVDQIHKAARAGSLTGLGTGMRDGLARQALMRAIPADDAYGRKYAYGGVQPHVARAGDEVNRLFGPFAGGIGGVGARANASDHPSGHALDFMTMSNRAQGNRVADFLQANAKRLLLKYQIWLQRIQYPGGGWSGMADRGSPTANHMDHVHASFLRADGSGGGSGGGGGLIATVVSWWSQLASKVTGLFSGIASVIPGIGGPVGEGIRKIPVALIGKVLDAARTKLESMMTTIFSGSSGGVSAGVEQWRGTVQQALKLTGQSDHFTNTTLRRMQQESGGNPRAINNWDSNAKRGTPSKGLMQVIDPTFRAHRHPATVNDIWDPLANVAASMRYALSRYGSLPAAYDRPGGYNTGGLLRPGQLAYNETHHPEMILNAQQTRDFTQLVGMLTDLVRGGGMGEGPLIGNLQVTTTPRATAQDIVEEATLAARRARRLGVHSRR